MNEELNAIGETLPNSEEQHPKEDNQQKKSGDFTKWIFPGLSIISVIGVAILFVLYFTGVKSHKNTPPKSIDKITYAYVNTDSLMAHYDFVLDVQVELANFEKNLQNQYTSSAASFKKEYEDYIKRAGANLLTLDQQKKTEEKLAAKQQNIAEMEQSLGMQMQEEKMKRNMEVFDSIQNYIARYNQTKDYTFVFQQSYGGALLFANPALDITSDILKGLNEDYAKKQKDNPTESDDKKSEESTKK